MNNMITKTCPICKIKRDVSCFYKNQYCCKECTREYNNTSKHKEYMKKYQKTAKYKEYQKEYQSEHYLEHKEEKKKYNEEYRKGYRKKHLKKIRESQRTPQYNAKKRVLRKKYRKNPRFRLDNSMANSISISLKGEKAGRKWESLVSYSIEDLIIHLEAQFDSLMNWDNYGSYWWVDHKKPRSLFNYIGPEDKEFKECWALKNLQPMEKIENIKKSNHY